VKPAGVVGIAMENAGLAERNPVGAGRRGGLLRWSHRPVCWREDARSCSCSTSGSTTPHPTG